jgi:lysophospholipase
MFQQKKDWETRENAFAAFSMGPLTDFWRQREEDEFTGVGAFRYALFVSEMKK